MKTMGIFNAQLAADIAEHNTGKSCLYNADQTGLVYAKLPNRMFVKKGTEKQYAGTKAMKAKDRVTLMVCTNAAGEKVPLAIVGKSKKPKCFTCVRRFLSPTQIRRMHGLTRQSSYGGSEWSFGHIISKRKGMPHASSS